MDDAEARFAIYFQGEKRALFVGREGVNVLVFGPVKIRRSHLLFGILSLCVPPGTRDVPVDSVDLNPEFHVPGILLTSTCDGEPVRLSGEGKS